MATAIYLGAATAAMAAPAPNVVILFVDDMGIDQIAVPASQRKYGYTGNNGTIKTPHISQLAAEGMVFQTWYSGFHVCTPSRAAMMTGRLPVRSGIGSPNSAYAPHAPGPSQGGNLVFTGESIGGLPLNETTMAEALRPHGYATLCVGKWHLGQRDIYLPTARGFDEYLGIPFSQDIGLSFWATHNYKPSPPYFPTPLPLLHNTTVIEQPTNLMTIAQKYSNIVTKFVAANAATATPYFVYLPFNHVHGPNSCGAMWCGQSARGAIGDAVEETDWVVGNVMREIKASGAAAAANTVVFFTSDNGAPQHPDGNAPLRGYKGSIWEGGYREPGIAWWPGKIKAGAASGAIVATYDLFPTVLSLAGVPLATDRTFDGIDISPVLFGTSDTAHECIMFYFHPHAAAGAALDNLPAVRCGDYKVYWKVPSSAAEGAPLTAAHHGGSTATIYNLATDPGESAPVDPTSAAFATALAAAAKAKAAHLATVLVVPDQNARGNDPNLAICGAPHSQAAYPKWPNCSLTPQFWTMPICGDASSGWCNQTAQRTCPPNQCGNGPHPHPPSPPSPPLPPSPPMPSSDYIGCFNDHAGGKCDLPHIVSGHCKGQTGITKAWPRTVEACNTLCLAMNSSFQYMGVQMGGDGCFCGNTYGSQGKVTDAHCNVACDGDTKEMCGGPNFNSVYHTRPKTTSK